MEDGYIDDGSVKICIDNFTKKVFILIPILSYKFGIKACLKKRNNPNSSILWRISKLSLKKARILISPYIIPEMVYKITRINK